MENIWSRTSVRGTSTPAFAVVPAFPLFVADVAERRRGRLDASAGIAARLRGGLCPRAAVVTRLGDQFLTRRAFVTRPSGTTAMGHPV